MERFLKALWIFGAVFISQAFSQMSAADRPVAIFQNQDEWSDPRIQPRNPPWQFSIPRKRFANPSHLDRRSYESQYSYNNGPFGPNFQQQTPNHQGYVPNFQGHMLNHQRSHFQGQNYQNHVTNYHGQVPDYQSRSSSDLIRSESRDVPTDGRLLSDSTFTRISETLGAINTVGHYLVDMVNENDKNETDANLKQVPQAIYTISKNVLGRNVTDKIAPLVKKALPRVLPDAPITKIATADIKEREAKSCTTPEGKDGICEDLSNCPQLLLNLVNLRESLCFKDLFVPGVCCPADSIVTTPLPEKPVIATTSKPTFLLPVTQRPTTTKRPSAVQVLTTKRPKPTPLRPATTPAATTSRPVTTTSFYTVAPPVIGNYSNIVDTSECGQREEEGGRIVGGTESKPGAWPWMAAIYLHGTKRREFWCGGTLVGPKHVLTAAHCTRDSKQRPFPARQFSVRLGDVDLGRDTEPSRPVTVRVAAVRAHEQFSRVGFYNDIALLVLADPVQKSKYVIPICLPTGALSTAQFDGTTATVVGWGTTRYGGGESSKQLEAKLPVWKNEDCDRSYFQPITDAFLCAGYARGGVDACQGDSGGPLMLLSGGRWTQIGVVSFGNKCGEPGYPGVYTRLTHYLDWLQQNLV